MGKEIESILLDRGHAISHIVDKDTDLNQLDFSSTDVVVEFSIPPSAESNIRFCLNNNLPIVVGTTGWYDNLEALSNLCSQNKGALLHATNFSVGVNIFFAVNSHLAKIMNNYPNYSAELVEIHHTQKLDAPSGTGISLAEQILANNSKYNRWENVKKSQISDDATLSIESVRLPDVPGTHEVKYSSDIDTIKLEHIAHNRKGFALGAVIAAEWINGKTGVFTMKDVLNF